MKRSKTVSTTERGSRIRLGVGRLIQDMCISPDDSVDAFVSAVRILHNAGAVPWDEPVGREYLSHIAAVSLAVKLVVDRDAVEDATQHIEMRYGTWALKRSRMLEPYLLDYRDGSPLWDIRRFTCKVTEAFLALELGPPPPSGPPSSPLTFALVRMIDRACELRLPFLTIVAAVVLDYAERQVGLDHDHAVSVLHALWGDDVLRHGDILDRIA
jgi:hypothetical protein